MRMSSRACAAPVGGRRAATTAQMSRRIGGVDAGPAETSRGDRAQAHRGKDGDAEPVLDEFGQVLPCCCASQIGAPGPQGRLTAAGMAWCQAARSPSWQDSDMERVLGIGGYFMRAADPVALGAWYRDCLGLDADENGLWRQGAGPTVFATFESETDYFGSRAQQTMLNFRVRDLDAMLAQLRAKGADVAEETQDMEGVGRFGWVTDPEGNRIELWQPA